MNEIILIVIWERCTALILQVILQVMFSTTAVKTVVLSSLALEEFTKV